MSELKPNVDEMVMRATLLGFTVPNEVINSLIGVDPVLSVQTHRFAWSLARTLRAAGFDVQLLSVAPASNYAGMKKRFFYSEYFSEDGFSGWCLGFANFSILKHVTRLFSCLKIGWRLISKNHSKIVFVHGIHSPFLLFGWMIKSRSRKLVIVLTDPPAVLISFDGKLSSWLKKIDGYFIKFLVRRADGILTLSSRLAFDVAPRVPAISFPGFLDEGLRRRVRVPPASGGVLRIAYAGALDIRYGVGNLIEAIRGFSEFPVRLELYGKGDAVADLVDGRGNSSISYEGALPPAQLYERLQGVGLIINPRPSSSDFTKYSFPSKIIEAMALGVPVMSTVLAGIPEDFFKFIHPIDVESVDGIRDALRKFNDLPESLREEMASKGRMFVENSFGESTMARKIRDFVFSNALIGGENV